MTDTPQAAARREAAEKAAALSFGHPDGPFKRQHAAFKIGFLSGWDAHAAQQQSEPVADAEVEAMVCKARSQAAWARASSAKPPTREDMADCVDDLADFIERLSKPQADAERSKIAALREYFESYPPFFKDSSRSVCVDCFERIKEDVLACVEQPALENDTSGHAVSNSRRTESDTSTAAALRSTPKRIEADDVIAALRECDPGAWSKLGLEDWGDSPAEQDILTFRFDGRVKVCEFEAALAVGTEEPKA